MKEVLSLYVVPNNWLKHFDGVAQLMELTAGAPAPTALHNIPQSSCMCKSAVHMLVQHKATPSHNKQHMCENDCRLQDSLGTTAIL
jgi:hypothetical protein